MRRSESAEEPVLNDLRRPAIRVGGLITHKPNLEAERFHQVVSGGVPAIYIDFIWIELEHPTRKPLLRSFEAEGCNRLDHLLSCRKARRADYLCRLLVEIHGDRGHTLEPLEPRLNLVGVGLARHVRDIKRGVSRRGRVLAVLGRLSHRRRSCWGRGLTTAASIGAGEQLRKGLERLGRLLASNHIERSVELWREFIHVRLQGRTGSTHFGELRLGWHVLYWRRRRRGTLLGFRWRRRRVHEGDEVHTTHVLLQHLGYLDADGCLEIFYHAAHCTLRRDERRIEHMTVELLAVIGLLRTVPHLKPA
mmetsp:Transcript_25971/g.78976  ORF Transcript_25971/g.78976 Transcript_25971/m.78976 type:complete len:306 (+) Transcript_25971:617-1534(+)